VKNQIILLSLAVSGLLITAPNAYATTNQEISKLSSAIADLVKLDANNQSLVAKAIDRAVLAKQKASEYSHTPHQIEQQNALATTSKTAPQTNFPNNFVNNGLRVGTVTKVSPAATTEQAPHQINRKESQQDTSKRLGDSQKPSQLENQIGNRNNRSFAILGFLPVKVQ
jgi:hypothetical protein